MKQCYLIMDSYFYKNKIFDLNYIKNQDYRGYHLFLLKQRLSQYGISLDTFDYFDPNTASDSMFIFNNIPKNKNILTYHKNIDKYLILSECEVVKPENGDKNLHEYFTKVFTWNDNIVDNKRYFKVGYPNKIPSEIKFDFGNRNKLCTMIAGNKGSRHNLELYTERRIAIRWFEKTHPTDFDLYGVGWDKRLFNGSLLGKLNRFDMITKQRLFRPNYISFKGNVKSKNDILQKYRFSICYENAKEIPGYITEKIFDCFFSGCIPIYLGDPNINISIPDNTFIDKREFKTYEDLYSYLKNMSYVDYSYYLNSIMKFLKSDKINLFSAEHFVETLIKEII